MAGFFTILVVVWSFWIAITIAAAWNGRSWFPFTFLAPLVLSNMGLFINWLLAPWGVIAVLLVHGAIVAHGIRLYMHYRRTSIEQIVDR